MSQQLMMGDLEIGPGIFYAGRMLTGEIAKEKANNYSILTICNYERYQFSAKSIDQSNDQQDDQEIAEPICRPNQ